MKEARFMELQYRTLRSEISFSRDRMYKTLIGGASFVPAAQYLADSYEITILTILLPILVLIMVLLFVSDVHAMMRCGRFIRKHIEKKNPNVKGWEKWLENTNSKNDRRNVDKFVNYGFYLLSGIYYVASTWLAAQRANEVFGLIGFYIVLGSYIILGFIMLILMWKWSIVSTKT